MVILAFAFLQSCTTHTVYVQKEPPPKVVEIKSARTHPKAVWIPGHWKWSRRKQKYVWVKGHWKRIRGERHWVDGHWKKTPHGWVWMNGYWK